MCAIKKTSKCKFKLVQLVQEGKNVQIPVFQLVQLVQEGKNVQSPVFQLVQLVQEPGGNLASIHSMAENDFLEGFVRARPVIDSRGGER